MFFCHCLSYSMHEAVVSLSLSPTSLGSRLGQCQSDSHRIQSSSCGSRYEPSPQHRKDSVHYLTLPYSPRVGVVSTIKLPAHAPAHAPVPAPAPAPAHAHYFFLALPNAQTSIIRWPIPSFRSRLVPGLGRMTTNRPPPPRHTFPFPPNRPILASHQISTRAATNGRSQRDVEGQACSTVRSSSSSSSSSSRSRSSNSSLLLHLLQQLLHTPPKQSPKSSPLFAAVPISTVGEVDYVLR